MTRLPRWLPRGTAERITVDPVTGCWTYTGRVDASGYGTWFDRRRRRHVTVHREVYAASGRTVPAGLVLDHLCHDPRTCPGGRCAHRRCCNPAHLEPVTPAENSAPHRRVTRAGVTR